MTAAASAMADNRGLRRMVTLNQCLDPILTHPSYQVTFSVTRNGTVFDTNWSPNGRQSQTQWQIALTFPLHAPPAPLRGQVRRGVGDA